MNEANAFIIILIIVAVIAVVAQAVQVVVQAPIAIQVIQNTLNSVPPPPPPATTNTVVIRDAGDVRVKFAVPTVVNV